MIEDALWITIRVIEKYQKECPEIYGHMKTEHDDLKEHVQLVLNSFEANARKTA